MAAVIDIGSVEVSTADHDKKGLTFLVTCKICHEDFTMEGEDNIHTTKPCSCKYFCEGCLRSYVHVSLQNRLKDGTLQCPRKPKCKSILSDDYVFSIADENDKNKYLRWKREAETLTSKVGTHRERNLGEKEKEILSKLDILTKPCPNCFEIIEKIEGCDHMRCPFCKVDFCWKCGSANLTGKYVRRCQNCQLEYIDHAHTSHHRRVFCVTFFLWFPLAILYSLFCAGCCIVCWPTLLFAEAEAASDTTDTTPEVSLSDGSADRHGDSNPSSQGSDKKNKSTISCCNICKLVSSTIFAPFVAISQFAQLHDCACCMPDFSSAQ